jgi:hypothetical protein
MTQYKHIAIDTSKVVFTLHRGGYRPAGIDSILRSLAARVDGMQSAGFTCLTVSMALRRARQNSRLVVVCDTAAAPTTIR